MSTDFSRTLALLRKERNISQRTAAADLGISQALLSHYEKGIREPGLAFVVRACDYYQVSADYLLGRTMSKDGTVISAEELYDVSEHKDNALRGSVMAQLNKKLMVNTLSLIYGMLGRLGNRELILGVSNYFSCALYTVFRSIYSVNKHNLSGFFALDEAAFRSGAVDAAMMWDKTNLTLELEKLAGDKSAADKLEPLDQKSLQREYPALYQSLLQILHNTSGRVNQRLADSQERKKK